MIDKEAFVDFKLNCLDLELIYSSLWIEYQAEYEFFGKETGNMYKLFSMIDFIGYVLHHEYGVDLPYYDKPILINC